MNSHALFHFLAVLMVALLAFIAGCRRKHHMNAGVQVLLVKLDTLAQRLADGVACQGGALNVSNAAALIRSFYKGGQR